MICTSMVCEDVLQSHITPQLNHITFLSQLRGFLSVLDAILQGDLQELVMTDCDDLGTISWNTSARRLALNSVQM